MVKHSTSSVQRSLQYITMANSRYCCFHVWLPHKNGGDVEANQFFDMIRFDADKIKESTFGITSLLLL